MTTQWTESAENHLNSYLDQTRAGLRNSGADAAEVVEDLRRHIEEELAAARIKIVTEHDLKRVLARLGSGEPATDPEPTSPALEPPSERPRLRTAHRRSRWLLVLGVIVPVLTIGIEMFTHMCAEVFFDPIPTVWHLLLAASVPAVNLALWWKETRTGRPLAYAGALAGFAIGIAAYFSLLYLPLLPFACIAIIFLGWGLLPMAPLFSLISAIRLSKAVGQPRRVKPMLAGFAVAVAALAIVVLPAPLTRYWSTLATEGSQDGRTRAVRLLRAFGHKDTLLRDCYGSTAWAREDWLGLLGRPIDVHKAREVYFRVTGEVFNARPAPQQNLRGRGWEGLNDFSWDHEHGGEAVGGRVSGLSLTHSRMDGLMNADQGWSYFEWILEFNNVAAVDREARAQIRLPAGGVVSRLTLWVNGEEREAAFAGRSQVREAYQNVAVVQRRDPVLVTSCGPDTVLMQCFPVPRSGGSMKVRLGITAPTVVIDENQALVQAPLFIERNFSMPSDFAHSIWVESPHPIDIGDGQLTGGSSNGHSGLRGAVTEQDLQRGLQIRGRASTISAWARDHGSAQPAFVRQRFAKAEHVAPQRLVIVLDGSMGMRDFYSEVAEVIPQLPAGIEVAVLAANDGVVEISPLAAGSEEHLKQIAQRVQGFQVSGGQDNLAAMMRGWDIAAKSTNGAVLWIHGPQPVLIDTIDGLEQRLVWASGSFAKSKPRLYELQTKPGPNRILEKLDGVEMLRPVYRTAGVGEDLARLFGEWKGKVRRYEPVYERTAAVDGPESKEGSKHIVRLWALSEVRRLKAAARVKEAIALAGKYQLVTPVSGAVVLETMAQFAAAGLTPVDAASVPMVPEPEGIFMIALLLVAAVLACRARRRGDQIKRQNH